MKKLRYFILKIYLPLIVLLLGVMWFSIDSQEASEATHRGRPGFGTLLLMLNSVIGQWGVLLITLSYFIYNVYTVVLDIKSKRARNKQ